MVQSMAQFCPKCGTKALDDEARFCNKCGNKLPEIIHEKKDVVCPKCGNTILDKQSVFCDKCGSKLIAISPVRVPHVNEQPVITRPITKKKVALNVVPSFLMNTGIIVILVVRISMLIKMLFPAR